MARDRAIETFERLKHPARRAQAGIVLLDVVLALAITALVMLVLMPRPTGGVSKSDLRIAGTGAAAAFRHGRAGAIRDRTIRDITVDATGRSIKDAVSGTAIRIPQGMGVDWVASTLCPLQDGNRTLRFLPDGRSCGGVLTLTAGNAQSVVRVDWLTGRVETELP
jgi:general secretion pathway protein H